VRIYNPESRTRMEAWIDAAEPPCDPRLQGMPPTGSHVELKFIDPVGSAGNHLLPTGRAREELPMPDGRSLPVSIVDAGAMYVFVRAADLGIDHATGGETLERDRELMDTLEHLRGQVAVRAGLVSSPGEALRRTPAVPKLAIIGPSRGYDIEGGGSSVSRTDVDLVARIISSQSIHKAYAVTGAIATLSAGLMQGSIVHNLVGDGTTESTRQLRIGHPTGVIHCAVAHSVNENGIHIRSATVWRTARRIMEGGVFVPARNLRRVLPRQQRRPTEVGQV